MISIFRKPTYANVTATLALVVALGGGTAAVAGVLVGAQDVEAVAVRTGDSDPTADSDGTQNGGAGPVATAVATAKCKQGEKLLGGGAKWIGGNEDNDESLYINEMYRVDKRKFRAEGIVDFGAQGTAVLQAQAFCLKV